MQVANSPRRVIDFDPLFTGKSADYAQMVRRPAAKDRGDRRIGAPAKHPVMRAFLAMVDTDAEGVLEAARGDSHG
eukprot:11893431-Prorocentrum_lima.AAC.1